MKTKPPLKLYKFLEHFLLFNAKKLYSIWCSLLTGKMIRVIESLYNYNTSLSKCLFKQCNNLGHDQLALWSESVSSSTKNKKIAKSRING